MTFRGALKMGSQNANKSEHIAVAISLANPLAGTLEKTAPLRSQICVRARSVTTMLEDMNNRLNSWKLTVGKGLGEGGCK